MGDLEVEKVVCVTGASGYIASWIVKFLLERGYTVKASVRDPDDPTKTQHLCELLGASDRLHLFKANLLDEGAFDSIVDGCIGVFHTASPCVFVVKDPQAELIEPAVKGTLNILSSCAKTPSIKRVIVTSSIAAMAYNRQPQTPDTTLDESSFSDPEFLAELQLWYQLSKTLAEESAWKFAKEHNIDMITINPGMVIGPLLQPTLNTTTGFISSLFSGSDTYANLTIGWVDVRDVMKAHILAFESQSASGRYCLVGRVVHFTEIIAKLRELYPGIQLPKKCVEYKLLPTTYNFCKKKASSLGVTFTPFEDSLKEMVECLKVKKLLNF
ncbi:Coumarine and phenylpropanoid biosynthesis [Ranunculus cassubicifolius]